MIPKAKSQSVDSSASRPENEDKQTWSVEVAVYQLIIAEDDPKILRGLAHHVEWERFGFTVAGAFARGEEALERIRGGPGCNAVLCDIRMPEVSGLEIARYIDREHPAVAVVLMSAYRDFDYARSAIAYNVRHYLLKPVMRQELEETFSEIRADLDERFEGLIEFSDVHDKVIKMAEYYVNNNLGRVTLTGLADHVGLSPNYLSKLFREKTGRKLSDFIACRRMEQAKELLKDHRMLIYQVGERLGYTDYRNFSRAFKHHIGRSPREYRESFSPPHVPVES
jgi:YesN/AraC family two-component response regulator